MGTCVKDLALFVGEARRLSIELDLTFSEEWEKIFSLAGKHGRIGDLGFLLVAPFVGENCLIEIFVFQSIVPVLQRLEVGVEGLQCSFLIAGAGFKEVLEGAEAIEEVIPHPQGDVDYRVCVILRGDRRIQSCQRIVYVGVV
jgi:hypothetical protein